MAQREVVGNVARPRARSAGRVLGRRVWGAVRALAVLAVLALAAFRATQFYQAQVAARAVPPAVPTTQAVKGNLAILLAGNGTLEAEKTYVISNQQVEAKLINIVEDGVIVKPGDLLAQLDTTKIEKDLIQRQLAYDQAKAQIAKAEAENLLNLNNATTKTTKAQQDQELLLTTNRAQVDQVATELKYNNADLSQADRQRVRKEALAHERLIPTRDAELAQLTVASKKLNVTQGEKKLIVQQHQERAGQAQGDLLISDAKFSEQTAKNKAEEQVDNAHFNAESALQQLELTKLQMKWCTVNATVGGLAMVARQWDESSGGRRALRAGDNVFPLRRLMDIIDLSRMRIVASVSEIDISRVRVGQPVLIRPRSAPDALLHGRVQSISSLARVGDVWRRNAIPGKKMFRMVVTVTETRPDMLRPGMTADFEVVEQRLAGVVTVPIQAVFRTSQGPAVFVKRAGRFRVRPVKTGNRNDNRVVVVRGLKGNEVIALERPPMELLEISGTGPAAARKTSGQAERKGGPLQQLLNLLGTS
jgi:HlyD family secretion protein